MGVTYSTPEGVEVDQRGHFRLNQLSCETLVHVYFEHRFPLFLDKSALKSVLWASLDPKQTGVMKDGPGGVLTTTEYIESVFGTFQEDGVVCTKEYLVVTVLLCDAPWTFRLGLLFDLCRNVGTEDMKYDDLVMLVNSAMHGLLKLWGVDFYEGISPEDHLELSGWIDTICSSIYLKLERGVLLPLSRQELVQWGYERFKESKTVATTEALLKLYASPH